jgi:ribosomal protein S12 methylthiotransferase accessory factor
MTDDWATDRYAGLLRGHGAIDARAHDPAIHVWAATLANRPHGGHDDAVGGAGWTATAARTAGIGEAIERWQTHRLPADATLHGRFAGWPHPEPAVDPADWVLFSAAQYGAAGFPFAPLDVDQ